ncbi:MAG: TetR/AcrR family transcriptional regulator [Chlamydiota bacterium]
MTAYSLRERKIAKQKIALIEAFVKQLEHTKFQDIVIKKICQNVEISEGTFYNYFPQKEDVIKFFKALQLVKMKWELDNHCSNPIAFERLLFAIDVLISSVRYYHALQEFNWVNIAEGMKHKTIKLNPLELESAFPNYQGITLYTSFSWEDFFKELVIEAITKKELPDNIEKEEAAKSLSFALTGVVFAIDEEEFSNLRQWCHRQLKLVWKGLQAGNLC